MTDKLVFQPTEKQVALLQPKADAMGLSLEELLRHIVEAWLAEQVQVASPPPFPLVYPVPVIYPAPQPMPWYPIYPDTSPEITWGEPFTVYSVGEIPSTWDASTVAWDITLS